MQLINILAFTNATLFTILLFTGFLKTNKKILRSISKKHIQLHRTIHKVAARLLVVTGITHGLLAVGGFMIHPGFVLYGTILLNICLIYLFKKTKKKYFMTAHEIFPLAIAILLVLHFLSMNGLI